MIYGPASMSMLSEIASGSRAVPTASYALNLGGYGIIWKKIGDVVSLLTSSNDVYIGPLRVDGRISQINLGYSTYLGYRAGYNDNLADNLNIAIGYESLYNSINCRYNVAIGYQSIYSMAEDADYNIAIGYKSLFENTSGYNNIAIGYQSLYSLDDGYSNIAIGNNAMYDSSKDIIYNISIGDNSLYSIENSNNIAIGYNSMKNATNCSDTVVIGHNSAEFLSQGSYNILIGSDVATQPLAYGFTVGSYNTIIGYKTVKNLLTGSGNTIIGADITSPSSYFDNSIIIANGRGTIRFYASSSGDIYLYPSNSLFVNGNLDVFTWNGQIGVSISSSGITMFKSESNRLYIDLKTPQFAIYDATGSDYTHRFKVIRSSSTKSVDLTYDGLYVDGVLALAW